MGDEMHALAKCCRYEGGRKKCKEDLHKIMTDVGEEMEEDEDSNTDIWQLMKRSQSLKPAARKQHGIGWPNS